MPYIPHTPESLLQRSDSKNPLAHCRGLTANGKPCRRPLGKSPSASPHPSPRRKASPPSTPSPGPECYCWQHKDQVAAHAGASPVGIQSHKIRERTSVDTLVNRLGLLEVEERKQGRRKRPVAQSEEEKERIEESRPMRQKPRPKLQSNLGLFCCIGVADDSKRAPRPAATNPKRRTTASITQNVNKPTSRIPANVHRPSIQRDPSSRTGQLLSFIPRTASPQTTALLLAELAKPLSELDAEGFIYMFWLTPESLPSAPPSETASSLLVPQSRPTPGGRRTSDVLNTFAIPTATLNQKTILLKIGRAQNVYRRLNQWTKQCGYNLSLIRYYPYYPSTPSGSHSGEVPRTPRKVPNANKVERLIHIELAGKRVLGDGKCKACGREHREWFEVDASREGVKGVDEVIRRWVDWGEREGGI